LVLLVENQQLQTFPSISRNLLWCPSLFSYWITNLSIGAGMEKWGQRLCSV